MKNLNKKKCISASIVLALTASIMGGLPSFSANALEEKYEFEDGTNKGALVETTEDGYSGSGYVDMKDAGQTTSVIVNVPSTGMYEVTIGYYLPADRGNKIQNLLINGSTQGQVSFSTNSTFSEMSGGVVKLTEGDNTVTIESSWGWTMLDYLKVSPAVLPEINGNNNLSDKSATPETQSLMNYLSDVYGNNIISGQQELYGQAGETEFDYIYNNTGKYPAIRGFDYMNWTQGVNWNDGTNDRIINWTKDKDGIATLCWHWFVPKDMSTYTEGMKLQYSDVAFYNQKGNAQSYTNFDASKAVIEGTPEYKFIMDDIEMIANSLKELQDQNIPVIFRPLHEAEGSGSLDGSGSWFWWGSQGAETYVKLYRLLYDTLTEEYGIHNLIWEWNGYTYQTSSAWYPGDDYVDLVAYDKYNATDAPNESSISGTFYNLVNMTNGKKMVAMAENDTIPSLENLTAEKAGWLYFCPWYGDFITNTKYNAVATLKELYNSDYCITLDELPTNLYSYEGSEVTTTSETTTSETTTSETTTSETTTPITTTTDNNTTPSETTTSDSEDSGTVTSDPEVSDTTTSVSQPDDYILGDANGDGKLNVADLVIISKAIVNVETEQFVPVCDMNSDGKVTVADLVAMAKTLVS